MHPIAKTLLCAALAMGLAGCVTTSPLLQQLGVAPQDPQAPAPGQPLPRLQQCRLWPLGGAVRGSPEQTL